ncbi:MAG: SMC-Scp complex subunit ScpB [Gammaproteobacteria bacterium]|nr:SMC-Scp complex subunit ScpB [Gammaproteobacteria bacterium]
MNDLDFDDAQQFAKVLEAILLAAAKPVTLERIAELFDEELRPSVRQIKAGLEQLSTDLNQRSYQLNEVASGFRLQVRAEYSTWVSRLWEERPQRYSRAMLETLALIAYQQPITRGEIEDVRGVTVSSHIIKTLLEREWIRIVGYKDVPGKPAMLATTKLFLDYFNLRGLDELPNLSQLKELQPTMAMTTESTPAPAPARQAHIGSDTESSEQQEDTSAQVSFSTLLAELDAMEQGLTTEFKDPVLDEEAGIVDTHVALTTEIKTDP